MKIAYLDCHSGISGDMTLGALVDAGVPLDRLQHAIDSLGLPGCRLAKTTVKKHGFRATKVDIHHEPEHAHRHLSHITRMIDSSQLTDSQKELATQIFTRLGEAEAKVHGTTLEKVHFHEVGAVDSIADIVGAAVGWDILGVDRVCASAIPTGCGEIEIAHGRVSVPAPATAELLRGIPLAPCEIPHELTTPTGAAIIATMVQDFGPLPAMTIETIGLGAGTRDLDQQANVLRILIGEAESAAGGTSQDSVWQLETNLDDVSAEVIGYAIARMWEAGALDVFTIPIGMKKNRPGVMLSVLAPLTLTDAMEQIIFEETGTLGVRCQRVQRRKQIRQILEVSTPLGKVTGKVAQIRTQRTFSPEFESCRRIAAEKKMPLREVYQAAQAAFAASHSDDNSRNS